jgi:hypothetical protein
MGTAVALPLLEAMLPGLAFAGPVRKEHPRRMGFLYVPNGIHMADWTPTAEGPLTRLPAILEPLQPVQQDLLVLSGLTLDKARPNGDGPGDHARAMSAFLTGAQPRKTHGADIRAGISVDQAAAQRVGHQTRFPSLELGIERGQQSGNCDSGYSCAYSSNISWRAASTPMAKEVDPRQVFERLFGSANHGEARKARLKREHDRQSILDFVQADANRLRHDLGATDQRKLDEYLTAVRELEIRVIQAQHAPAPIKAPASATRPAGIPQDLPEHIRLMCDMLALAFQTDSTRIATLVLANDGSNRPYPFVGVSEGHHDLSHHGNDKKKQEKIRAINHFHISQFAYLVQKLKAIAEGDGALLDNCMIVYGSGISDGNAHNHDELPILLAGKGRGTLKTGRHVRYPKETPLTNLYLSMLDRMEAPTDRLGDSTGRLPLLST